MPINLCRLPKSYSVVVVVVIKPRQNQTVGWLINSLRSFYFEMTGKEKCPLTQGHKLITEAESLRTAQRSQKQQPFENDKTGYRGLREIVHESQTINTGLLMYSYSDQYHSFRVKIPLIN